MAARLFNLRNVPDDEASEVRQLLEENHISFYETKVSGWGFSSPAIWLNDEAQLDNARALLDAYQKRRAASARAAYEQLKQEGNAPTLLGNMLRHPFVSIGLILAILFVLYVSLSPFIQFGK